MSPRSAEFLTQARARARQARRTLEEGDRAIAVSLAYYAMLYAARAALSEAGATARTHSGTWHIFHREFVATGRFPALLASAAQSAQDPREGADYEAREPDAEYATAVVDSAERFVAAVEDLLAS